MKKCVRCQIDYEDDSRVRCLYCDSKLMDGRLDRLFRSATETQVINKLIAEDHRINHERVEHLIGSYFRSKSFSFLYAFNRQQYKMGKRFKRIFVQPLDFSTIIRLPWFAINLLDSIVLRLFFRTYCPQCDFKCKKFLGQTFHTKEECSYNQEYSRILNEIMTGSIILNESRYKRQMFKKLQAGERSAYFDLCSKKRDFEIFIDMVVILISIALIIYVFIQLIMPTLAVAFDFYW